MPYPTDIGVVDLMIGFPMRDKKATYDYLMHTKNGLKSKNGHVIHGFASDHDAVVANYTYNKG